MGTTVEPSASSSPDTTKCRGREVHLPLLATRAGEFVGRAVSSTLAGLPPFLLGGAAPEGTSSSDQGVTLLAQLVSAVTRLDCRVERLEQRGEDRAKPEPNPDPHDQRVGITQPPAANGQTHPPDCAELLSIVLSRLDRIESDLKAARTRQPAKKWYTTAEVAEIFGVKAGTVREYCRTGRIRAKKKNTGRGKYPEWSISHEEVERIESEGLLTKGRPPGAGSKFAPG